MNNRLICTGPFLFVLVLFLQLKFSVSTFAMFDARCFASFLISYSFLNYCIFPGSTCCSTLRWSLAVEVFLKFWIPTIHPNTESKGFLLWNCRLQKICLSLAHRNCDAIWFTYATGAQLFLLPLLTMIVSYFTLNIQRSCTTLSITVTEIFDNKNDCLMCGGVYMISA